MLQTMIACRALPNASAKRNMSARVRPEPRSSVSHARLFAFASTPSHPAVRSAMKFAVQPIVLDQMFQHAVKKRNIAADVNLKKIVREPRPEQRALRHRRNPVALQPRLEIRIHHENFRALLLRVIQILRARPADCWRCSCPQKSAGPCRSNPNMSKSWLRIRPWRSAPPCSARGKSAHSCPRDSCRRSARLFAARNRLRSSSRAKSRTIPGACGSVSRSPSAATLDRFFPRDSPESFFAAPANHRNR